MKEQLDQFNSMLNLFSCVLFCIYLFKSSKKPAIKFYNISNKSLLYLHSAFISFYYFI